MMHWPASESRRVVQEILVPTGPEPEPGNRWPCEQLRHFRVALPSAMSLAARRAFISGVPTSDVRADFGLHLEGWKHALHELTEDSEPFEGAIARVIAAAEAQRRLQKDCQWGG
eukprot:555502-Pleurochrysis_carterae.AAC.1